MHRRGRTAWSALGRTIDRACGPGRNPLRHLGSLGFLFLALLAVSGVYLYAALDTSVAGAYRSIDGLSREQWYLGGILRSLHRYSADALVLVTVAHLVREWLSGHHGGFRRQSWLTGVPLPVLVYVCGIGGLWLCWDERAQFSAIATAELLDWLPLFGMPLTRNFIDGAAVSDRLFSLFVFVHIGGSLVLLMLAWIHLRRIAHPAVFPPRAVALGAGGALLAAALVAPVSSGAPAALARVPDAIALDWFLLLLHPLTDVTSAGFVWALLAATFLVLLGLPFARRAPGPPVATVSAGNCTGCRRCFDDCPYAAIEMLSHPDRPGRLLARVDAAACASCGICVGACPTASPLRRSVPLVGGLDMPQAPVGALRADLERRLLALCGERRLVVFGCDHGARVASLENEEVVAFSLLCIGMLPPAFVDYALRRGATGVLVTGCATDACAFRLGSRWTAERLKGRREPRLRPAFTDDRLAVVWAGPGEEARLLAALAAPGFGPPAAVRESEVCG